MDQLAALAGAIRHYLKVCKQLHREAPDGYPKALCLNPVTGGMDPGLPAAYAELERLGLDLADDARALKLDKLLPGPPVPTDQPLLPSRDVEWFVGTHLRLQVMRCRAEHGRLVILYPHWMCLAPSERWCRGMEMMLGRVERLLAEREQAPAREEQRPDGPHRRSGRLARSDGGSVNQAMAEILQKGAPEPEWSGERWAREVSARLHRRVTRSAIYQTTTWKKTLPGWRAIVQAERGRR